MTDETGGTLVRERLAWERDFTQIPNLYLRDKSLSFVARGILAWLMTHDSGYQVTMLEVQAATPREGREAVRIAVAELEKHGYLHRQTKRGKGGRLAGHVWHLMDPFQLPVVGQLPLDIPGLRAVDNSRSTADGLPSGGAPSGGAPTTVSRPPRRTLDKEHISTSAPIEALGQPVDNFGAVRWSEDRCPGNYRDGRHELGQHGSCRWCHERPVVRSVQ